MMSEIGDASMGCSSLFQEKTRLAKATTCISGNIGKNLKGNCYYG
jgi:hypothetical protein